MTIFFVPFFFFNLIEANRGFCNDAVVMEWNGCCETEPEELWTEQWDKPHKRKESRETMNDNNEKIKMFKIILSFRTNDLIFFSS